MASIPEVSGIAAESRACAVVLSGGTSRRMGGVDKTAALVGGASCLERVVAAVPYPDVIVVGPDAAGGLCGQNVTLVREEPSGSGPLAALARGVEEIDGTGDDLVVLVLAADLPLLTQETLQSLAEAARDGRVHALQREDRIQYLCAAWPLRLLREGLAQVEREVGGFADVGVHRLYRTLSADELSAQAGDRLETLDVDTPEDLAAARRGVPLRVALGQITVPEEHDELVEILTDVAARAASAGARILILPEATLTPFGTDLAAAARDGGTAFEALLDALADRHGLVLIAGSFALADDGRVHNRVHVRGHDAQGPIRADYDKIHLYDAFGARESDTIAPGQDLVLVDVDDVRIGLATCYDIRFPEQFLELARRRADVIAVPMAWGDGPGKVDQLRTLLQARALDSTCLVLACDQAPPDGYDSAAPRGVGRSAVISPLGAVLAELDEQPGLLVTDLDLSGVDQARRTLPVLEHDRRPWS